MSGIYFLLVITKREFEEQYVEFYKKYNVHTCFETYAYSAAIDKGMDYLGVEDGSQIMHYAVLKEEIANKVFPALVEEMGIAVPGNGLAALLPVRMISGETSMKYLTRGQKITEEDKNKEGNMTENSKEMSHVLVTVVVEKGFTEMVTDALKEIGLTKVTIIRSRTIAKNDVNDELLGMALADEKEIVHIVVEKKDEETVIKTVMENAGMDTDAHGAAFSMPLTRVAGF